MSSSRKYLKVTERYLTDEGLKNSAAVLFPPQTLLYAMYASIGECCISTREMATSQAILGIECGESLNVEFLFYVLQSRRAEVVRSGQQGTQANLNAQMVRDMCIPLPAAPEQRAIAEALADADALVESLDALIAKKRDMKQAAMQQLLTGRTRLPGFTDDWREERLGDICEIVMGQSPESRHYNRAGNGLPLIQGNADIANRRTIQRVWTTSAPKRAEAGDVLLTVRAPVGAVGRASAEVCLGRGVCAVKSNEVVSDFLFHALVAGEPRWSALEQGSTFTAANGRDVADFTVCVPEQHSEQQAIAEVLSDMDDEIDALVAQREKAELVKQGMMHELLSGRVRLV
jgi:type I restriction enzyme S subunit